MAAGSRNNIDILDIASLPLHASFFSLIKGYRAKLPHTRMNYLPLKKYMAEYIKYLQASRRRLMNLCGA